MTGFYIDERIGLTVMPGCGWNEKASTQWKCADFTAPPRKSKLLATDPNEHPSTDRRLDWMPDYPENDDKPIDAEWDWGKA